MFVLNDKILGGLWGLLVGDAVGVPYEFHSPEDIAKLEFIDINPPSNFGRSHNTIEAGTWSDDGAQALCLLASLLSCGKLDIVDLAKRLLKWYEEGYFAIDNEVFDVGVQTAQTLLAYKNGMSPLESGMICPNGKGNGALMRVLPLALWHKGSDEDLIKDAHMQCLVTHGHPCNQVCCALYCIWARRIFNGLDIEIAYDNAIATLRNIYAKSFSPEYIEELESTIRPDDEATCYGSGYVVDTLRSAKMLLLKYASYEEVIKGAIALGDDTDTTAAVAGGLAGIKYGFGAIPEKWLRTMKGKELVEELFAKLAEN